MEFDRAIEKFGTEPDIEGLVPSLQKLTLEEFQAIPFRILNELLHINFPQNANGDAHTLLFDAIQTTSTDPIMQNPLELVLRADGLWIRICHHGNPKIDAEFDDKTRALAEKFYLDESRITNSYCPDCVVKMEQEMNVVAQKRAAQRRRFQNFLTPTHELPAVARKEETI